MVEAEEGGREGRTRGTGGFFGGGGGGQAMISWRSPLTRSTQEMSRNQGSELPSAAIVPQGWGFLLLTPGTCTCTCTTTPETQLWKSGRHA